MVFDLQSFDSYTPKNKGKNGKKNNFYPVKKNKPLTKEQEEKYKIDFKITKFVGEGGYTEVLNSDGNYIQLF